jgi:DNA-binding NarL/FixJ family response regulator
MKIKILIVEDEPEWLDLFFQELRPLDNIEIADAVTTVEKAVEMAKLIHPEIVLMDLSLSKESFEGITAITKILQEIDTKIIVVTSHFDKALIEEAFYAGAVEYLLKHQLNRLSEIIKEVYENTSPHVVLANTYSRHRKESQFNTLSKAEKEILQLKKQGFSHNEIEKMAYKAESTLKHQVGSLLKKLNVSSCQEALKKFKQFIE